MDTGDIAFIILLSLPLIMWIGGEIRFRKSKDAKWIKKARGNKSVKKYYYSAITRRHNYIKDNNLLVKDLNEIEKKEVSELLDQEHQLHEACKREEKRMLCRAVPWFFIILMLGTYIYHGGK